MAQLNPHAQYLKTAVETATSTRLVVMLYDGAIRFLSQALPAMRACDYETQTRLSGGRRRSSPTCAPPWTSRPGARSPASWRSSTSRVRYPYGRQHPRPPGAGRTGHPCPA